MIKIFSLIVLLIFGFCGTAFAQSKKNPPRFLLTTAQTAFRIGEDTKVKLTFENKTGKKINPDRDLAVQFRLIRTSVTDDYCRWNDCYVAWFVEPTSKVVINNGETLEMEFDLADLFWMDSLDSNVRITMETIREKNFFKKIVPGNFNLKAELHHTRWRRNRFGTSNIFESNSVPVTIQTKKEQQK